jgi:high-affinity nickel permease
MGMIDAVMSALFVIFVVFMGLVILYVLMRIFTSVVRVVEANVINKDEEKGGA